MSEQASMPTVESSNSTTNEAAEQQLVKKKDIVVQYIIVRRDLLDEHKWPTGSVMGQACHAAVAVIAENYSDEHVQQYLAPSNIDQMHKVVMQVNNEEQLLKLRQTLSDKQIRYRLWVEQPENFPTAIAIKPYPRSMVQKLLKKLKLFA